MREAIKQVTALIKIDGDFIGSGVIFLFENALYTITAGHNIYGKKFNISPNLKFITVETETAQLFTVLEILGDVDYAKKFDLVILKLDKNESNNCYNILTPKFISVPSSHPYNFISRGKSERDKICFNLTGIKYDTTDTYNDHHFLVDIDKQKLQDEVGKFGSDALGGISGSGIYIDDIGKEIWLLGILISIPDSAFRGKIKCTDLLPIKLLIPDFPLQPPPESVLDSDLLNLKINEIIENNNQKVIEDWETRAENSDQIRNIKNKLNIVYPQSRVKREKLRIIKNFLDGEAFIRLELSKNEHLMNAYKQTLTSFKRKGLFNIVNNQREAIETLKSIGDNYENLLIQNLKKLDSNSINILAHFGISFWLADCELDFTYE